MGTVFSITIITITDIIININIFIIINTDVNNISIYTTILYF